ncbi:MAG: lipopolysaccharide biosynthesis protein RfbH [Spirochaetes bacterium GWB1_36_13]|nr:MAG: lipopolysaccharide biosynthesis protein RfbH [Spirochaetes bacterium GWB1_36_13]
MHKSYGEIKPDFLDQVLRLYHRFASKTYFESKPQKKNSYIPVSGKVIDEQELYCQIDASLDMWLTSGRFNDEFEKKLASFIGVQYALTTNSGSSANLLALTALTSPKLGKKQLKPGDEVISVAAGFPTTITPIIQNHLIPVFVDVELGSYNIDVSQIEESITDKTKAIMIAHTLGNPFNIDEILRIAKKYDLWVVEDNCDALGSKYDGKYTGQFGHIATLSFYPAHHITMGEGGALLTNDGTLYQIIMSYRDWGRDCWCPPGTDNTCSKRFNQQHGNLPFGYDHKYVYSHLGYNLKIVDTQAAVGLAQLDKLPGFIEKRKENYKILYEGLKKHEDILILPKALPKSDPSWFGFPVSVQENSKFDKIKLVKYLEDNQIGTRQLFAGNMLRQPAFLNADVMLRIRTSEKMNSKQLTEKHYQMLPNTDKVMNTTFWLGVWPGLNQNQLEYIVEKTKNFFQVNK